MDLSDTILANSDRLIGDDLMGGPMIIVIEKVVKVTEKGKKKFDIHFGDGSKPFKPCTTMRRLIVKFWGTDGTAWKGREIEVFRDPSVTFGTDVTGGVRISGLSDIPEDTTVTLNEGRGKKKTFFVRRLGSAFWTDEKLRATLPRLFEKVIAKERTIEQAYEWLAKKAKLTADQKLEIAEACKPKQADPEPEQETETESESESENIFDN